MPNVKYMCRDVFNERPTGEDAAAAGIGGGAGEEAAVLPRGAIIHTSRGDITVKLFPDECPRTIENFAGHARSGYYEGLLFHRVIRGFMVQTGDPLGMPVLLRASASSALHSEWHDILAA